MHIVIGVIFAIGVLLLAYGAITGKVRAQKSCCSVADPMSDQRIAGAISQDVTPPAA